LISEHADVLRSEHAWPHTLAELVEVMSNRLRAAHGYDDEESNQVARDLVMLLGKHLGGRMTYLPKGDQLRRAIRDAQIYHEFNGVNHNELAARFQLSSVSIYSIVQKQKQLLIEKVQPSLFE
jgi:Mor family transcriptional regulator